MSFNTFQATIGGADNIPICSFLSIGAAADNNVILAKGTTPIIGVAPDSQEAAPVAGANTYAGAPGDALIVNSIGTVCLIKVGSGGAVVRGDMLAADGTGLAVTAPAASAAGATTTYVGAQALESAAVGELVKAVVVAYERITT